MKRVKILRKNGNCFGGKTLLETFLDITFCSFVSPFRISSTNIKGQESELRISQWKGQKILAGIVAAMDIFGCITKIRNSLEIHLDNPIGYFDFMWTIAVTLMHLMFYYVLWTKQQTYLDAVKIFRSTFSKSFSKTKLPCSAMLGYCLCGLSLFLGLLPSIKGSHLIPHPSTIANWDPALVFKAHVTHAKFMFFFANASATQISASYLVQGNRTVGMDELATHEIVGGVAHIFIYTSRYLGAYFIDLFMIMTSVTLWLGVNEFVGEAMNNDDQLTETFPPSESPICSIGGICVAVEEENEIKVGDAQRNYMISKYKDLKSLADAINKCTSPILFFYVFETIFYYATNLNVIFTANDWHARMQVAHFLVGCSSVFGFSADVTRKMNGFRLWLVSKSIGSESLIALIQETQITTIGVSAWGIFTIDYPLIFNIVTTTVTFFLIVVQKH